MIGAIWSSLAVLLAAAGGSVDGPPPPFGVRGTVLNTAGQPVTGAEVRLVLDSPKGGKLADTTRTDDKGRFSTRGWIVSASDGAGDWRVEVSAHDFATSVVDQLFLGFGSYDVGPIYLFPPVLLTGRVTDEKGRPVAGAAIHVAPGEAGWSRYDYARAEPLTLTQADGSYRLQAMPPGPATVGVSASGYADSVTRKVVLSGDEPNVLDCVVVPERPFHGRVVDPKGAPIAGARIEAEWPGFWSAGVETGADGSFVVHGLGREWRGEWKIRARRFCPARRLSGGPTESQVIAMTPSDQIVVRVEREGAGASPKIAIVSVRNNAPLYCLGDSENWTEARSDSDLVEPLGPSAWRVFWEASLNGEDVGRPHGHPTTLRVDLDDGFTSWTDPSNSSWKNGPREITVRAPRAGRIFGEVLRSDDGSPIAGTTVMLNRWSVMQPHLVTTTDYSGRFLFENITPGDLHDLDVDNERWSGGIGRVEVRSGETTPCILRVEPPPRIRGRITINGNPPREPVVIGLGEFQAHDIVDGGWFGLGISDPDGRYSVIPKYDRRFTVVPKRRTKPEDGGYRRFRSEFPKTRPESWPWQVNAPAVGETTLDLDVRE